MLVEGFCSIVFVSERKLRIEQRLVTELVENERGRQEHEKGKFVPLTGEPWVW